VVAVLVRDEDRVHVARGDAEETEASFDFLAGESGVE
jgi:hypothetical protein